VEPGELLQPVQLRAFGEVDAGEGVAVVRARSVEHPDRVAPDRGEVGDRRVVVPRRREAQEQLVAGAQHPQHRRPGGSLAEGHQRAVRHPPLQPRLDTVVHAFPARVGHTPGTSPGVPAIM
jgi:hypothetical protein